jgi:predicted NAD-dependent protein-ADP-ribosyltransferase YbiA (DUF1768 family)
MVQSLLNPSINYPEIKILDKDDIDYDATLYQSNILGVNDVKIALGQPKYSFIESDIIYFPIYLVINDLFNSQIGVYEIFSTQLPNITDEDDDIDLDKLSNPLIYSFVTKKMLLDSIASDKSSDETIDDDDTSDDEDDEDDDDDTSDDDDDEDTNKEPTDKDIPPQNQEQLNKEKKEYTDNKSNLWVQRYIKSNEFNIIDNEGGGDCLFAVIRDAFKSIDKDISVADLRKKVSDEITPSIYETYKTQYDMYVKRIQDDELELKRLSQSNEDLRQRLKMTKERDQQLKIIESGKVIGKTHANLKKELAVSKDLLNEFRFMKNIHSVEDLKKKVKTCDFWADTYAISTLERVLKIKLIILSSENFKEGDISNILLCGELTDDILSDDGTFEPQYYIILDHTGDHYKLISYMGHTIFSFPQIPYFIKLEIIAKCLEKNAGPYSIIPQFKLLKQDLGIEEPVDIGVTQLEPSSSNSLYDENVVFQFYNKSNTKPLPGMGNGEKIQKDQITEYTKLKEFTDWRRKLDDDYMVDFDLDGFTWPSVTHYYEANKFKDTNKDFYLLFTKQSDSKISKDVNIAKAAASTTGKYKGDLLRSKDIKIDPEFEKGKNKKVLEDALYAKFDQHPDDFKIILLSTKKALLKHFKRGLEPEIANELMLVRDKLK